MVSQINPELLEKWKKNGELLIIWRCERCYKKLPLYKSKNPLINSIYLSWTKYHQYCDKCKKKLGIKDAII